MFEDNNDAFLELDEILNTNKCGFRTLSLLSKYLKSGGIDKQGNISRENFKLRLKCYSNPNGVEHFLSQV